MKRWIALLLAMALSLSLAACSQSPAQETAPGDVSVETQQESETPPAEDDSASETDEESSLLSGTYKVPGNEIYVDTPNYPEYSDGYTTAFAVYDSRYAAFTYGKRVEAADAKDAQAKVFELFAPCMESYGGGVNSIDIQKDELLTINGMEVYSFEGVINYGFNPVYDGYAKGYSFIVGGMPCHIIGSVLDGEQPQELIDEISAIVDEMICTVRTEP